MHWASLACRTIALALVAWTLLTTIPATVDLLRRHELRIEIRPRPFLMQRGPTWT